MGLDIVLYNKQNKVIKVVEFEQKAHNLLFNQTNNWSSCLMLRKIKDYYKTDVFYYKNEISILIEDLKMIKNFLNDIYVKNYIDSIILELNNGNIEKIHFGSD
jgi:hypothetical protein